MSKIYTGFLLLSLLAACGCAPDRDSFEGDPLFQPVLSRKEKKIHDFSQKLDNFLSDIDSRPIEIHSKIDPGSRIQIQKQARVADRSYLELLETELGPFLKKDKIKLKEVSDKSSLKSISIEYRLKKKGIRCEFVVSTPVKGRIVLIVDDVGYNLKNIEKSLSINIPMAFAILPFTPHARESALILEDAGFEIMLHQPMEPLADFLLDETFIRSADSNKDIRRIFRGNLSQLPQAKGVNNHMGSRATASQRVMRTVLTEVKRKRLYFVDSLTTPNSVASEVASDLGIVIAVRDVFLDNKNDREAVHNQLNLLPGIAEQNGYAIGIGHLRPITIEVIAENYRDIERRGFIFITPSELLRLLPGVLRE